jgi:hypothetical protein
LRLQVTLEQLMANPTPSPDKTHVVSALFRDIRQAERAYSATTQLGYEPADINVLMSDKTRESYLSSVGSTTQLGEKAAEPVPEASKKADVLGGPAGGTMGTIAPAIAAIGAALLLPGLGLAVAGPVAVALTAAGTAGLATGLIGAFTNWGIPTDQVERYENSLRKGAIVLGVEAKSAEDARTLTDQWLASGAEMITR